MSKSKKEPLSVSEQYAYQFQNAEPKSYTRVPNIIDHLTYTVIDGKKKTVKRLSVYAKELYRIIRMVASDNGVCWNCTESLALKIGCSVGMIVKAKKELLQPMDQLDGNALIIEKRKSKKLEDKKDGRKFGTTFCVYTVINIWAWNNAFMATVKFQNQYGRQEQVMNDTDSCGESLVDTDSCGESDHLGTDSCGERNNISLNKISLFRKQQPTESHDPDSVCLSKIEREIMSLSAEQRNSFEALIQNDFDEKSAIKLAKKYSPLEFEKAAEYYKKQKSKNKSKGKNIADKCAYFVGILQRRYWENSKL